MLNFSGRQGGFARIYKVLASWFVGVPDRLFELCVQGPAPSNAMLWGVSSVWLGGGCDFGGRWVTLAMVPAFPLEGANLLERCPWVAK